MRSNDRLTPRAAALTLLTAAALIVWAIINAIGWLDFW